MLYVSSIATIVVIGAVSLANQLDKLADAIQQVTS